MHSMLFMKIKSIKSNTKWIKFLHTRIIGSMCARGRFYYSLRKNFSHIGWSDRGWVPDLVQGSSCTGQGMLLNDPWDSIIISFPKLTLLFTLSQGFYWCVHCGLSHLTSPRHCEEKKYCYTQYFHLTHNEITVENFICFLTWSSSHSCFFQSKSFGLKTPDNCNVHQLDRYCIGRTFPLLI
jgi:hypothetical protein